MNKINVDPHKRSNIIMAVLYLIITGLMVLLIILMFLDIKRRRDESLKNLKVYERKLIKRDRARLIYFADSLERQTAIDALDTLDGGVLYPRFKRAIETEEN